MFGLFKKEKYTAYKGTTEIIVVDNFMKRTIGIYNLTTKELKLMTWVTTAEADEIEKKAKNLEWNTRA